MAPDLVVVGASAGGVQALRTMVQGLPDDLAAAVLVVLHIPMGAPSALAKILARSGALPANTAQHGEQILPGRIYVAPAGQHLLVDGDRIALSGGPTENGHRPAVDPLFRSAAQHFGPRVLGVILSGSRDDGAAGLAAVAERGGVPIVQDPETAQHRSMPCAALEKLPVEHVLPPAEIGRLVAELVGGKRTGPEPPEEPRPVQTAVAEVAAGTLEERA